MSEPRPEALPPLNGLHLAAGAWRAMRANARPMLALGVVSALVTLAAEQLLLRTGGGGLPALTPAFLAATVIQGTLAATISGLVVRLILRPDGPRWRIDGPLLGYVAVTLLMALISNLLGAVYLSLVPPPPEAGAAVVAPVLTPAQAVQMIGLMAAMIVAAWLWLRLTLWPVGILLADRAMRPSRSFHLMRRAVLGVILAFVVLGFGPFFVYVAVADQVRPWGAMIGAPFLAFIAIATAAIQAETYRRRLQISPAGLASAFD